jgi:hypothetical protein
MLFHNHCFDAGTISLFGLGILTIGALLPDIDTPKSFFGRIFFFASQNNRVKIMS